MALWVYELRRDLETKCDSACAEQIFYDESSLDIYFVINFQLF